MYKKYYLNLIIRDIYSQIKRKKTITLTFMWTTKNKIVTNLVGKVFLPLLRGVTMGQNSKGFKEFFLASILKYSTTHNTLSAHKFLSQTAIPKITFFIDVKNE